MNENLIKKNANIARKACLLHYQKKIQSYVDCKLAKSSFTNNDHAGSDMSLNGLLRKKEKGLRGRDVGMMSRGTAWRSRGKR